MSALPFWLAPHAGQAGLGALIDHTVLRPEVTETEIRRLCAEAVADGFGAVCVNGQWVATCAALLAGSPVRIAAVVGFPLGASGLVAKAAETRLAIADGASEIDMVIALGHAKAGEWSEVRDEIAAVVAAARGAPVKAILETAALTPREAELACHAALEGGAAFVKTSTGFHPAGGATIEMVELLRRVVGTRAGVKASGGIRTADEAYRMLLAGADRIGTSAAAGWREAVGPAAPRLAALLA
jgi:deoxyribose-phosphate aldolase